MPDSYSRILRKERVFLKDKELDTLWEMHYRHRERLIDPKFSRNAKKVAHARLKVVEEELVNRGLSKTQIKREKRPVFTELECAVIEAVGRTG